MKVFVAIIKHSCGVNHRFFAIDGNQAIELRKRHVKLSNTHFAVMPILELPGEMTHKLHKERMTNKMYIGEGKMRPIYLTEPCLTNKIYMNVFSCTN